MSHEINWGLVKNAMENNKYIWRTIRGIAKELNTNEEIVSSIIAKNGTEVIKSSIPAETGEALYTTRNNFRQNASPADLIKGSISGQVKISSIKTKD